MSQALEIPWSRSDEMATARRVQSRLLPSDASGLSRVERAGLSLPARGIGGDFYDFIEAGPGRLVMVLGDVSGKGVPAALMMAVLQSTLRTHYVLSAGDLARRLESVNRFFVECTASAHYAGLFVGEYDEASEILRYANCGSVPPFVVRRGLRVERLESTCTVLGLFDDWTCGTAEVTLDPQDLLVLVSDGATEATGVDGSAFGDSALATSLLACRDLRAAALVRAVADAAVAFTPRGLTDDLTVVAARVRPRCKR